nr:conotoxin precursor V [Conus ebraeus]
MSTPRMMLLIVLLLLPLEIPCGDGQAFQGDRRLRMSLLRRYKERDQVVCPLCDGSPCCGRCDRVWESYHCVNIGK